MTTTWIDCPTCHGGIARNGVHRCPKTPVRLTITRSQLAHWCAAAWTFAMWTAIGSVITQAVTR